MPTKKTDPAAFALIETEALRRATDGAERIAVREVLESVRAEHTIEINNNDAPRIARELVAKHPHLAPLIETRALGTRGKNKKPAKRLSLADMTPAQVVASLDHDIRDVVIAIARRAYNAGVARGKAA